MALDMELGISGCMSVSMPMASSCIWSMCVFRSKIYYLAYHTKFFFEVSSEYRTASPECLEIVTAVV